MAESRIESEFLDRDIQCWRPTAETQHDLLAHFNGDYQKVQVKHTRYREDDVEVNRSTINWHKDYTFGAQIDNYE